MAISAELKKSRLSQGKTLEDVAYACESHTKNIWLIENGKAGSLTLFDKVVRYLDIDFNGLPSPEETFGARLKAARIKRGWTQAQVADKARVSVPVVGRLERDNGHLKSFEAVIAVLAPKMRAGTPKGRRKWSVKPDGFVHTVAADSRFTPPEFLKEARQVIGFPFDLDPASHPDCYVKARRKYFETWQDGYDGLIRPSSRANPSGLCALFRRDCTSRRGQRRRLAPTCSCYERG